MERRIDQLVAEQKQIKKPCKHVKNVTNKKAALKEASLKKQKIEKPIPVEIELLLNEYNISAAAYHGGKLNCIVCRCFMHYASAIFFEIKEILFDSQKPELTFHGFKQISTLLQSFTAYLSTHWII
jgi:hypothetical protein